MTGKEFDTLCLLIFRYIKSSVRYIRMNNQGKYGDIKDNKTSFTRGCRIHKYWQGMNVSTEEIVCQLLRKGDEIWILVQFTTTQDTQIRF